MNDLPRGFWNRLLTAWVLGVARFALPVVLLAGVGTYFTFQYVVHHLHISTDREKMLSDSLDFRKDFDRVQAEFPQYKDNLVLVVDAETPELARDTALAVADRLRENPELFPYVYLPRAGPFLEGHALYYLDTDDLQDLGDRLTEIQPFLGRLTRDQSLRGLFDMLGSALEARMDGTEVELGPVFKRIAPAIEGVLSGQPRPMSWQELMQDKEPTPDERRQFVVTRPAIDPGAMFPAAPGLEGVRRIVDDLGLDGRSDVVLRITGGLALNHEELSSVAQGAEWIGILVLLLVATILVLGLRSLRLVLTTLAVLMAGMIFTAWFATTVVGHLNLISVAFAALYIGLGVDYAIHFCLRYQELVRQGKTHTFALQCTASDVGISLFVCAATTALAFYSFVPTSYSGVSELGLISGTGMFISLFVTLTLLPALLTLFPRSPRRHLKPVRPGFFSRRVLPFPVHHRKIVLGSTSLLTLGALVLLPRVSFDANPMHLKDPSGEAVQTYLDLLRTSDTPPWQITVLRPDGASARAIADRLEKLDVVDKAVTLSDFVPGDQEERLAVLEDLSLVLGPELGEEGGQPPPTPAEEAASMRAFSARLDTWLATPGGRADAPAKALRAPLGRLLAADDRGAGPDPDPLLE
ncbi:MAG: MMPL family transporter, partial [Planctomycetota bacterium]